MPQDDSIQDIIDRIGSARDRFQNAGDDQGVRDADQALSDLKGLDGNAMPTALDVEEYFNERAAIRVKKPKDSSSQKKSQLSDDDSSDDS
jgi:hypothetical protein